MQQACRGYIKAQGTLLAEGGRVAGERSRRLCGAGQGHGERREFGEPSRRVRALQPSAARGSWRPEEAQGPGLARAPPQLLPSAPPAPNPTPLGRILPRLGSHLLRGLCLPLRRSIDFWRPWADLQGEKEQEGPHYASEVMSDSPGKTKAWGKLSQYRHPVRLFWPKSKCFDYLYQEAEALLKKFPIQATISFYEDSDSEDEIEELTCDSEN
ncbi:protein ripply2 [Tamandua tetradactyla]|uniref:protein ripply2 n=1 Tax=Tamandua tetradactyla TaxID=48850 RepID=UPI0040545936